MQAEPLKRRHRQIQGAGKTAKEANISREAGAIKSRLAIISGNVHLLLAMLCGSSAAKEKEALRLAQTISMPNVKGRFDHIDVDVEGKQLFVAGLENGSLEVVDLKGRKWIKNCRH